MPPHPLTNFEIQKYYQNEPRFTVVFPRDNLPNKIKNGAYVIYLDECPYIGTHLIALYAFSNNVTYFDSSGVEHIPKEFKKFIGNKYIQTNIFRKQAYNSVMYGYFCTGFINFMLKYNSLTGFTDLFSTNDFKKNNDIILNYFKNDRIQFHWNT